MSSREHECPQCWKTWHCEGCETTEVEKVCEGCMTMTATMPEGHTFKKDTVDRYTFRGPHSLWAVISVSEDVGLLQVSSDFGDYSYRWAGPGMPFKKFLAGLDRDPEYLIGKLAGGAKEVDEERTRKSLRECIEQAVDDGKVAPDEIVDIGRDLDCKRPHMMRAEDVIEWLEHDHEDIYEKVFDSDPGYAAGYVCYQPPAMVRMFFDRVYRPLFVPALKAELGL